MTSVEGATDGVRGEGGAETGPADGVRRRSRQSTPVRIAAIAVLLVLCAVVARTCQQSQIRITQEQAVATAKEQVDFKPTLTEVRLLRQGLGRQPFWIVSLSIPKDEDSAIFKRLAVVRIDANNGEVASIAQDTIGQKQER